MAQMLLGLYLLAFPTLSSAQGNILYFSPVSGSFSRLPPIGVSFDITFAKPITRDTLVGVRLESFGFIKEIDTTLQAILNSGDIAAHCQAISRARSLHKDKRDQILYQDLGRQAGADQGPIVITHPQLYYRRAYLFGITYYYKATTQRLKQAITQSLAPVIETVLQRQITMLPGGQMVPATDYEAFHAQLQQALDSVVISERLRQVLPGEACTTGFVLQNGKAVMSLGELVHPEELMTFFNEYLSKRAVQRDFESKLLAPFEDAIRRLRASAEPTVRSQMNTLVAAGTLSPFTPNTLGVLKELRQLPNLPVSETQYLERALASTTLMQGREQEYTSIKQYFRLTASGASQGVVAKAQSLASGSSRHLRLPVTIAVASVGQSSLFVQTLRERLPYHISIDGGVAYTPRFKQAMPTASFNIKIWPGDMDDPQIRWEPSLLIGLGFRVPDDEENFTGFFGDDSKRPLLLGLGIRNNKVAGGAVRLTLGTMLYRVKAASATPPAENIPRAELKQAPYVGLSLNSEILSWVSEKFKSVKGILP